MYHIARVLFYQEIVPDWSVYYMTKHLIVEFLICFQFWQSRMELCFEDTISQKLWFWSIIKPRWLGNGQWPCVGPWARQGPNVEKAKNSASILSIKMLLTPSQTFIHTHCIHVTTVRANLSKWLEWHQTQFSAGSPDIQNTWHYHWFQPPAYNKMKIHKVEQQTQREKNNDNARNQTGKTYMMWQRNTPRPLMILSMN